MTDTTPTDFYISVDVETAGPNPGQYSLLTIGACTLGDPQGTFYMELQPVNDSMTPESHAIHRLDLKRLSERGHPPAEAMALFEDWIKAETPPEGRPKIRSLALLSGRFRTVPSIPIRCHPR